MTLPALLCFLAAAGLAWWLYMAWPGLSQDWLPDDLKAGKLARVEEDLTADEPEPVIGRPDQVYRLATGLHVPVELKNRDSFAVYDTDIAEISLRAWLLRKNGMPTAGHGYVVINNRKTGKREAQSVELENDAFCEQLIHRYIDLVTGRAKARMAHQGKCKSCGHRSRCH